MHILTCQGCFSGKRVIYTISGMCHERVASDVSVLDQMIKKLINDWMKKQTRQMSVEVLLKRKRKDSTKLELMR